MSKNEWINDPNCKIIPRSNGDYTILNEKPSYTNKYGDELETSSLTYNKQDECIGGMSTKHDTEGNYIIDVYNGDVTNRKEHDHSKMNVDTGEVTKCHEGPEPIKDKSYQELLLASRTIYGEIEKEEENEGEKETLDIVEKDVLDDYVNDNNIDGVVENEDYEETNAIEQDILDEFISGGDIDDVEWDSLDSDSTEDIDAIDNFTDNIEDLVIETSDIFNDELENISEEVSEEFEVTDENDEEIDTDSDSVDTY